MSVMSESSEHWALTKKQYPPTFLRCRTMAFGGISFFSFLWIVLLCVVVFFQWEALDRPQQSLIVVMLIMHTLTIVMMVLLIIREFRNWLDGARCFLVLLVHGGVAGTFAFWSPRFQCRRGGTNQDVCYTRIVFILVTSWVIPTLMLIYTICLGIVTYRLKKQERQGAVQSADLEKRISLDIKWDWEAPQPKPAPCLVNPPSTPSTIGSVYSRESMPRPMTLTMPQPLASSSHGFHLPTMPAIGGPVALQRHSKRQSLPGGVPASLTPQYPHHPAFMNRPRPPPIQTGARQLYSSKSQPIFVPLDPPPHQSSTLTNHQRNLHYSALFQQAPRTPPATRQSNPIIAFTPEVVPPLPSPWRNTRHESQHSPSSLEYLKGSPSSLEYLKGDSPSPRTSARLSKPPKASRMSSL